MKFDGNLAWKQASAAMAANRELLLALAGVFFFLPSFALIMLFKQPQVPAGATPEQVMAAAQPFMAAIGPWLVIGSVVQALGQLTLFELFGRSSGRPTVSEALRTALGSMFTYLVVQLLTGFMMTLVLVLALALGGIVSTILGAVLGVYLVCQAYARIFTAGAVIVLEDRFNPFTVLMRAFSLSRGNGFRLGNFLFLLVIAMIVGFMVVTVIVGIIAALTLGQGRAAEMLTGFFSSVVSAVAVAYFVAIVTAVYRQLTAPAAERSPTPFD
jgi:hypothetical protein